MKETRYLIHFGGRTMIFYIRNCAEIYAQIYNTNVVEFSVNIDPVA